MTDQQTGWEVAPKRGGGPVRVLAESVRAFKRLSKTVQIIILGVVAVAGISIGVAAAIPKHNPGPARTCYDPTNGVYGPSGSKAATVCVSQSPPDAYGSGN
jgi:hypothetical protein